MPCKGEFPQLVKLHEKYGNQGLAAISVSLDEAQEEAKQGVLSFLQTKKATLTNLILDESQEFWQAKFEMDGPPCIYVFNKEGKWTQFKGKDHYPEVEKLIVELLKTK